MSRNFKALIKQADESLVIVMETMAELREYRRNLVKLSKRKEKKRGRV